MMPATRSPTKTTRWPRKLIRYGTGPLERMIRPPRYSLFIPLGETLGTDLMEGRGGEGEHQGIKTRTMKEKGLQELIEQTFDRLSCPFRSQGVYTEIYQAMIRAFEL